MSTKRAQMAQEPPVGVARIATQRPDPHRHLSDELSGHSGDVAGRAEVLMGDYDACLASRRPTVEQMARVNIHHGGHVFEGRSWCREDRTGRPKVRCHCLRCPWVAMVYIDAEGGGHGYAYDHACPAPPVQLGLFGEEVQA